MTKTVVTFTPLPVSRDSRTIKILRAFKKRGFNCVVIENVIDPQADALDGIAYTHLWPTPRSVQSVTTDVMQSGRIHDRGLIKSVIHFLRLIVSYWLLRPIVGFFRVPKVDFVYVHEYRLFPVAWLVSKRDGAELLYDAHDLYAELDQRDESGWFWWYVFRPLVSFMDRFATSKSDYVVTTSPANVDYLARYSKRRPLLVRNIHDESMDLSDVGDLRARLLLHQNDIVFAVVGHRKRGQVVKPFFDALVKASSRVHVVLIGRGYEIEKSLIADLGLADRVHFIGAQPADTIVPLIRQADVGVSLYVSHSLNYQTTLPNGVFQCIAAGLPLIYPPLPEIMSLMREGAGLCVDPNDATALGQAIADIAENDDTRHKMSSEIRTMQREIQWDQEVSRIFTVLA